MSQSIDKMKKELEKKKSEMEAIQKKITEQEIKDYKFTSSYILPPALEAIAGHICLMNERDYYVAFSVVHNEDEICFVLSQGEFHFANVSETPYSCVNGIIYEGFVEPRIECSDDIAIPLKDFNRSDIPIFFVALFEYTDKGYVVTNIPVNRKTGEMILVD